MQHRRPVCSEPAVGQHTFEEFRRSRPWNVHETVIPVQLGQRLQEIVVGRDLALENIGRAMEIRSMQAERLRFTDFSAKLIFEGCLTANGAPEDAVLNPVFCGEALTRRSRGPLITQSLVPGLGRAID